MQKRCKLKKKVYDVMKPKILYCGYREWSLKIYDFIKEKYKDMASLELLKSQEEINRKVNSLKPDLVFFIGWSWIVDKELVKKFKCICLHPSPLPRYRGGSPLQHQIINGEEESAVTLFLMDEFIDKGPIVWQEKFYLDGDLNEIFLRIVEKGKKGLGVVIDTFLKKGSIQGTPQNESKATNYKRRTPDMSEIKLSDFKDLTAKELYNKVRALQDPYPNAFVVCKDGTKLYLQKVKIDEEK
jgi:methionyl-tRNA formyltransferase